MFTKLCVVALMTGLAGLNAWYGTGLLALFAASLCGFAAALKAGEILGTLMVGDVDEDEGDEEECRP